MKTTQTEALASTIRSTVYGKNVQGAVTRLRRLADDLEVALGKVESAEGAVAKADPEQCEAAQRYLKDARASLDSAVRGISSINPISDRFDRQDVIGNASSATKEAVKAADKAAQLAELGV